MILFPSLRPHGVLPQQGDRPEESRSRQRRREPFPSSRVSRFSGGDPRFSAAQGGGIGRDHAKPVM